MEPLFPAAFVEATTYALYLALPFVASAARKLPMHVPTILLPLIWYDRCANRRPTVPEEDYLSNHWGVEVICITQTFPCIMQRFSKL